VVVEGVMEAIATKVAREVNVPIIGIGASAECDGQVLVTEDMLGLFERTPRFVKRYADLAGEIGAAAAKYRQEVIDRGFPTADQTYRPKS
jgi:3-methyl-2-oxobutanoate hydroxymethyltransferase